MNIELDTLKKEEQISLRLEGLYEGFGYRKFKMRSFEEYSMYYSYSDFLLSKNIITFNGLDGKLLALRPDVTLSIIKNTKADEKNTEKLFYNEKVYREFGKSKEYKEISQTGVEFIGRIDTYAYAEITMLALKSLKLISSDYALDISDMSVVESVITAICGENVEIKAEIYRLLKAKNTDDFLKLAILNGYDNKKIKAFETLVKCNLVITENMDFLDQAILDDNSRVAIENFKKVVSVLSKQTSRDKINVNFSIFGNADYYNGLIFNGYISKVPKAVLTGGRYDKLLEKFGKNVGAIGFALYLGEIERYLESQTVTTDMLILYDDDTDIADLIVTAREINQKGLSVRVDSCIPSNFAYKKLMRYKNGELIEEK